MIGEETDMGGIKIAYSESTKGNKSASANGGAARQDRAETELGYA